MTALSSDCLCGIVIVGVVILFSYNVSEGKVELFFNGTKQHEDSADYTLESGENLTIVCKGDSRVEWMIPEVKKREYKQFTKLTEFYIADHRRNFKFVSQLDVYNITYPYVGFYTCSEYKKVKSSKRLYIFVHDDTHLTVMEKAFKNHSVQNVRIIIPCRPTSPDVNVTITTIGGTTIDWNTTSSMCENSFDYNPHEGIFTEATIDEDCEFQCVFSRVGSNGSMITEQFSVHLFIEEPAIYLPIPVIKTNKTHFVIGSKILLECMVDQKVDTAIEWKYPMQSNSLVRINPHRMENDGLLRSTLEITNVTLDNTGKFVCSASDFQGNSEETSIMLTVHDDDNFVIFNSPNAEYSRVYVGEDVEWNESFEAYPQSIAVWLDNKNNRINDRHTDKFQTFASDSKAYLAIKNITYSEHGEYKLVVNNGEVKKFHSKFLIVSGKPEIDLKVARFQLPKGKTKVECEVTSYPKAEVYLEYKPCTNETCQYRKMISKYTEKDLCVKHTAIISLNESSTIKCSSTNTQGSVRVEKEIYVSDIPDGFDVEENYSINFDRRMGNVSVALGETVNLTCGAFIRNETQRPEWWIGDKKLKASRNIILQEFQPTPETKKVSLIINNTEKGGNYSCILNEKGTLQRNKTIIINVSNAYAPILMSKTKVILKKNLEDHVELTCETMGLPKPKIQWYKEDQVINDDNDHHFNKRNGSLMLMSIKLEDEGDFRCVAVNNLGRSEKIVSLEIRDKPSSKAFYWIIIVCLFILAIIAIVYVNEHRKKKVEELLKQIGLSHFEEGQLENLNPELGLEDQIESLPYDRRWEFPAENLKIGKPLGSGAFGVVVKGEAKGIVPGEERTTVAVKMVKKDAGHLYMKALASELKIMSHLGNNLNVVNLLGACTKDITKGQLYVIVEYCKFGNTHNYLYRHRSEFIDQIDRNTGAIDFDIGNERLERSYSVASNRSFFPMKYVTQLSTRSNSCVKYSCNSVNKLNGDPEECKILSMCPRNEEGDKNVTGEDEIIHNSSSEPEWRTNYRGDYKGSVRPISTKDLVIWAYQVAKGMEYLASRKVLHGDLAARNILLADDNVVKICDFGLAKSIYKNDNYKKNSNCPLPFKWMAIESIRDRIFSTQSDVWAYGIVLWEFFSLAKTPYPGMEADEKLYRKLLDGYRMEAPEYATDEIYKIMLECWNYNPLSRPSFYSLGERLGYIIGEQMRQYYLDLNDPHLKCNTERRESGIEDYLEKVCPPDFENLSTPQLYMNQPESSPGYLSMKSPGINSPRPEDTKVFNFEPRIKKKSATASLRECLQDDVFIEEEENTEDPENEVIMEMNIEPCDADNSCSNPSYLYPMKIDEAEVKRDSSIQKSSDNYILMAQARNFDTGPKVKENVGEIIYVNQFSDV